MSPVASLAADKRFRRAHVKPGQKRRRWRTVLRGIVVYGVVLVALAFGCYRVSIVAAQAHMLQVGAGGCWPRRGCATPPCAVRCRPRWRS
jgi:hypothetical protein